MRIQTSSELDKHYTHSDPWSYEQNPDDENRRVELLSIIPKSQPEKTLDIGCGDGFITFHLPGKSIVGVDISTNAINIAKSKANTTDQPDKFTFLPSDIFDLPAILGNQSFDLIVITGVLYPQYIGKASQVIRIGLDNLLNPNGHVVSCHISEWYTPFFWYTTIDRRIYKYREFSHLLEVYKK